MRILFALSAAPFTAFAIGPLTKLFSHADPTAYTADGRIVLVDTNGLSAYLSWLRQDVLDSPRFAPELDEDFSKGEVARLRRLVAEGEELLKVVWQRPGSARRLMKRKHAEIGAALAALVTQERASEALYTACFPDQVLLREWRMARERDARIAQRAASENGPEDGRTQRRTPWVFNTDE